MNSFASIGRDRRSLRSPTLSRQHATRLCGSADLCGGRGEGRRPSASVNFLTVHDGFTLTDLVSYNDKHNDANLEGNRDGSNDNRSWNCGTEGPSTDVHVTALRGRQKRALLATLLLSAGVPLLLGGDEFGRTQRGNNNAYCQDNEISWFDWSAVDQELMSFASELITLRRHHPIFRRRRFLSGPAAADLRWLTPSGCAMTEQNWTDPFARSMAMMVDGSTDPDCGEDGVPLLDDDFLVLINGWWEPLTFTLPALPAEVSARCWQIVCDTFDPRACWRRGRSASGGAALGGRLSLSCRCGRAIGLHG
ncbi:MAG: hypothetical protein ACLP3C_09300 [Mycobacterium sp.]|uniref:hypothetical protein n=1 Tax=Mycobacterium sp. TaxID=1785 RepID=UPI003F944AB9